jgi:putative addiction module component (TIGR02574 family)
MIQKNEIYHTVKSLPLRDRVKLVDFIYSTFDKPDESIELAWNKECKSRVKAVKSGKMKLVSADKVLSKFK